MRLIDDGDRLREFDLADLMAEFKIEVNYLHQGDIDQVEYEAIVNQYAYVKFGLILEKIRNQCLWKRCAKKFLDFKSFCEDKINLNCWQALNAIESAQVVLRLVDLGFTDLPRNASQALKLAKLSIERLGEVWGEVVRRYQGAKITALAIDSVIDPDKQPTSSTIRLPARLHEKLARQAIERGMTLSQYLNELANEEDPESESVEENIQPLVEVEPFDQATMELMDELDRKFATIAKDKADLKSKKFIQTAVTSFDQLMNNIVGQFIPPISREPNPN